MAGKSKRRKYGEFRVFVEYKKNSRFGIRDEFIPSIAAWLLMQGRAYQKAIDGLNKRLVRDAVPGITECIDALEASKNHIQRLLNVLPQTFHMDDWGPVVQEICALMHIQPDSAPVSEIMDDTFHHLVSEMPDGHYPSAGGHVVPVRTGETPSETTGGPSGGGHGRANRKRRVPKVPLPQ